MSATAHAEVTVDGVHYLATVMAAPSGRRNRAHYDLTGITAVDAGDGPVDHTDHLSHVGYVYRAVERPSSREWVLVAQEREAADAISAYPTRGGALTAAAKHLAGVRARMGR